MVWWASMVRAPDDACGEVMVVVPEVEAELLHGGAGAGAAAEEEDLGGAFEGFGDGFVETFEFRLSLAAGIVLIVVVKCAAEAVGIVGGDGFRLGAVEFGSEDAGFAMIDDDEEVWADGAIDVGAGLIGFDELSFHEGISFWKVRGGGRVAERPWSAGLRGRVLRRTDEFPPFSAGSRNRGSPSLDVASGGWRLVGR